MKKLALVLGGGAAKGYAHVGVLKVLEENGIIGPATGNSKPREVLVQFSEEEEEA